MEQLEAHCTTCGDDAEKPQAVGTDDGIDDDDTDSSLLMDESGKFSPESTIVDENGKKVREGDQLIEHSTLI